MKVKFFVGGNKYAVVVSEGAYEAIVPTMRFQLAEIGYTMVGIENITIHHNDGRVEKGIPTTNAKGELTAVGVSIF